MGLWSRHDRVPSGLGPAVGVRSSRAEPTASESLRTKSNAESQSPAQSGQQCG